MGFVTIKSLQKTLYDHRFVIFFVTQVILLFGPLLFTDNIYKNLVSPLFLWLNLLAGFNLLAKKRRTVIFFIVIIIASNILVGSPWDQENHGKWQNYINMATYFSFFTVVTLNLIKQVWDAKWVDRKVILGSISGFISLGLMGFFICISIYMGDPNAFSGLTPDLLWEDRLDEFTYYSFITLLTIGYGDILPVSALARKASLLIGIVGQFYNLIIMAVVLEKYIRQGLIDKTKNEKSS